MMQFLALVLLAATAAASESKIILPNLQPQACWVLMVPPSTVKRSVQEFLSQVAVRLLSSPKLGEAGSATLAYMNAVAREGIELRISEKQDEPLLLSYSYLADVSAISLSLNTAEQLIRATTAGAARATSVEIGADLDLGLAKAWLRQLAGAQLARSAKYNLWSVTELRHAWTSTLESGTPTLPAAEAIARELWPRVSDAHPNAPVDGVARAFGPAHAEKVSASRTQLERSIHTGLPKAELEIRLALEDYQSLFLELGRRAADLEAARKLSPGAGGTARLVQAAQERYAEIYVLLTRKLGGVRLVISTAKD